MGDTKFATSRARDRRSSTGPADAAEALALQQLAGNAAIGELVAGAQAKLRVGGVDDPAEAEADAVADRVVHSIRTGAGAALETTTGVARQIQRRATPAATDGAGGGALDGAVDAARGGGQPLPPATLAATETAFGADFGDVRVHTGPAAGALNDAVDAHAFTVGTDIFFRDGVPAATDPLLAHELTHVVQQGGGAGHDHTDVPVLRRKPKGSGGKLALDAKALKHVGGVDTSDEDLEDFENDISNLNDINDELTDDDFVESLNPSEAGENALTVTSGVSDTVFAFVGIATALKKASNPELSAMEEAELFLELYGSTLQGATGIANIVAGAKGGADGSEEVAGGLGAFGEVFSGIKETFGVVKKIVDLANETDAERAKTSQEKFHDAMEIINGLLEAAKAGVSAAKDFLDTFTSAGPGAALSATVPGFSIALGAADMIVRSVDLVTAMVRSNQMRKDKREFKESLGGKKGTSYKKEAEKIVKDLDAKRDRGEELTDEEEDRYDQAESYLVSKGLQYINDKRRNRALLKMSVAMTKAAGDVATLGGASAPVGVGLKVGALALDVGASLFRKFKQWGRDKKAAKEDKGEDVSSGFFSIFDADKSTKKKFQGYNKTVDKIFKMVIAAEAQPAPTGDEKDLRFARVEKWILALGMAPKRLYLTAQSGKIKDLRKDMIKAQMKRE
jgi:hypothetical protein